MRKPVLSLALGILATAAVAVAAKPKPMECDAWACKGEFCAPAKYQAVRHAFIPPWLLETPIYGAALTETGLLSIVVLGGLALRRRGLDEIEVAKPVENPEVSST